MAQGISIGGGEASTMLALLGHHEGSDAAAQRPRLRSEPPYEEPLNVAAESE